METESCIEVSRVQVAEGMGNCFLVDLRFQFCKMEKALELDGSDSCIIFIYLLPLNRLAHWVDEIDCWFFIFPSDQEVASILDLFVRHLHVRG